MGKTEFLTMEKRTSLAEIPGLKYRPEAVANLQLPPTLDRKPLSSAARFSIRLAKKAETDYDPKNPDSEEVIKDQMMGKLHNTYICCLGCRPKNVNEFMQIPEPYR